MQEITFFAGITDPNTLNLGRDIYALNSNVYEIDNDIIKSSAYKELTNITAYKDLYRLMMKLIPD